MYLALLLQIAVANDTIPHCSSGEDSTCSDGAHDDTNVLIQRKVDTSRHSQAADRQSGKPWTVDVHKFSDTMTMTARVFIDGTVQSQGTLASFMGPEIHGVQARPSPHPPFGGGAIYQMTIYADKGGEDLTFRFKTGISTRIYTLTPKKPFTVNGNLGNARTPLVLENDPKGWDVNPSAFPESMSITAQVKLDGAVQSQGTLAAFKGSQIRGAQFASDQSPFGAGAIYMMQIYGNKGGDPLTLKFMSADGQETELEPKITFKVNDNLGDARSPIMLEEAPKACGDAPKEKVAEWTLEAWPGYNWRGTCAELKTMCTAAKPDVTEICAATCGKCAPAAPCTDSTAEEQKRATKEKYHWPLTCAQMEKWQLCKANDAKDFMAKHCSKTCDFCKSQPQPQQR
jgi:hypothetical protein